jgi:hypothetical protein
LAKVIVEDNKTILLLFLPYPKARTISGKRSAIGFLGYSEKAIFALFGVRVQPLDTYPEKTVFYFKKYQSNVFGGSFVMHPPRILAQQNTFPKTRHTTNPLWVRGISASDSSNQSTR